MGLMQTPICSHLIGPSGGADGEAERSGQQASQQHDCDEKRPACDVRGYVRRWDVVGQRKDSAGGDDALHGGEDNLLNGDSFNG